LETFVTDSNPYFARAVVNADKPPTFKFKLKAQYPPATGKKMSRVLPEIEPYQVCAQHTLEDLLADWQATEYL
jgi:hypothetical protein